MRKMAFQFQKAREARPGTIRSKSLNETKINGYDRFRRESASKIAYMPQCFNTSRFNLDYENLELEDDYDDTKDTTLASINDVSILR